MATAPLLDEEAPLEEDDELPLEDDELVPDEDPPPEQAPSERAKGSNNSAETGLIQLAIICPPKKTQKALGPAPDPASGPPAACGFTVEPLFCSRFVSRTLNRLGRIRI